MRPTIMGMVEDEIRQLANLTVGNLERREWDLGGLANDIVKIFPLPKDTDPEQWRTLNATDLADLLVDLAERTYDAKEAALGAEHMRQLERLVMLREVDTRWVRHLTDLDELREGIGLRAFAQVDPLIAYKKEAHEMYQSLLATIAHDVVHSIYHAQLLVRPAMPVQRMQTNRTDTSQPQSVRSTKQPGRNDPCWCGSGKKYKYCHMRADQGQEQATGHGGDGADAPARVAAKASAAPAAGTAKHPQKGRPQRRH